MGSPEQLPIFGNHFVIVIVTCANGKRVRIEAAREATPINFRFARRSLVADLSESGVFEQRLTSMYY